ncbi:chromosome segregation protein SMC [Pseudenhygromyxa sp. WMMC2535]|uniref:chromosome segregation protein SMC n=1 Tax=Pseudenhygromyxa sp. WMMC2535 TaxID=2712867 RepID=UPI001551E900|nr:chromosome segregation protein SMC [Pseudenhygromyxa sp. WMMC2535]NVB42196.1 chromosome segregation protein SMC [Pseudenhygromyxa sp. WMMC2535]
MRIRKIEVVGFKSFADREVVVLDDRVTAVIGPNGCGKSNIVDAIRWCLGEQRAKHLRGSGMADVIFAGSSTRGPAGMAEVTITFETEGDGPSVYLEFPEIAVTRRLYRDGTSEYLINKVPCRLRDINDMLMGTGVSAKSGYSIIEQGRVGQIVTSKPETRRQVIDEAAGITKFKQQKVQATRRIDQTRQNLLRVTDVIGELEGRLGTLKRQAQKAERYKRYRTELRDLELWHASHKLLEQRATEQVLEARRRELDEQVEDLRNEAAARETRYEAERVALREAEGKLQTGQQRLYDLENRIQLIEQDRRFKIQEQEGLRRSSEQSRAERDSVDRGLGGLETELEEVERQRAELGALNQEGEGEGLEVRCEALEAELNEIALRLRQERETLERTRGKSNQNAQRAASLEATLLSRAESVAELRERIEAMNHEVAELERSEEFDEGSLDEARGEVEVREQALVALREGRQQLDRERSELREQLRAVEVEVEVARKELLRARSRLQSLEEIQSRYQACHGGVQVVMEQREKLAEIGAGLSASAGLSAAGGSWGGEAKVLGIMADYISAPAKLEPAVSAVLGDRLQGVVVDGPLTGASGVELLKQLDEGRTTFLPMRARPPQAKDRAGSWSVPTPAVTAGPIEVVDLSGEGSGQDGSPAPTPAANTAQQPSSEDGLQTSMFDALVADGRGPSRGSEDEAKDAATSLAKAEDFALAGVEGVVGRLVDLVDVEGELRELVDVLLGDTVIVEGLARALEIWHRMRAELPAERRVPHTFVTLEGDRIEPSGVVVGGASDAIDSALLQQKREIGELQTIVAELEENLEKIQRRRQGLAERLDEVERGREASEGEVIEAEKALLGARNELNARSQARDRVARSLEQLVRSRGELLATADQRERERGDLEGELADLREEAPDLEDEAEALQDRVEALGEEREQVSATLTELKVQLASWQEQRNALATASERLRKQIHSERERSRRLGEAAEDAERRVEALVEAITNMVEEHSALLEEHKLALAAKLEAVETHEGVARRVEELELTLRNLRTTLEEDRERLQEVELGLRELVLERQHLEADIRDRFDADLRTLLIDFHDRGLVSPDQIARVKELKRVLSRMGEVNLTAIAEYEEVSGRYEYLAGQRRDLEDAINQLQEAIDRINETTKVRFAETFEAVNEMFQRLFPRLFAGGQAKLVLTDPNDLLTTGVEILAQPPGKKVASLELLSGGEKALTAVSLVFGIFLIKSSPFCLLDEVDAPLDEANVGRFSDMVSELSEGTQFIIITHNKRTMEIADRLYGVTMQQRGVSKLVSVNMRRAVAEAMVS